MARLAELTRGDSGRLADRGAIVILPLGSTEQHGPHLPTGTDSRLVEAVAGLACERLGSRVPVVVAPTLHYGCSAHHLPFGGTGSISTATYLAVLADLGASLVASGFRRLFLLNGHGGNHYVVHAAANDLALSHKVHVAAASWWLLAVDALTEAGALAHGNLPGHAGAFETSAMLACAPALVSERRPERETAHPYAVAFGRGPHTEAPDSWIAIDGWSDNPAAASAEAGSRYLELSVDALSQAIIDFATRTGLNVDEPVDGQP